ncbi:sulfatase-like hydrolase/transferase [Tichowtungia aerotolerans]|uniref:Sulfatase-like hydrolase/transferase n=1 Tax=Tichowtungia aerotolerans TaxID=2697043 RepID=A0A6P1MH37_9BACT|nr:sulfatase-like hydrolase/transferase [Tichowtungia aerotolerans]QHI70395.1 sulfatase-like hydrolase/transferase [Tichowtungia aerotolerans]
MQRRDFVKTGSVAGLVYAVGGDVFGGVAGRSNRQPNILLIMPDQMRGDCLSVLSHPVVKTPTLDKLASDGVLFERAYATVPSCIPARYAMLTGLSPQSSGVVGFAAKTITTPTLPDVLASHGYSTVLVGRNMHQRPESGTCGYQKNILGSTYEENDDYDRFLRREAPNSGGIRNLIRSSGNSINLWPSRPWPLSDHLHPTAWTVARSKDVIRNESPDKPLFLTTSFYSPHPPLFSPKKYFDQHMTSALPEPARGNWVDWDAVPSEGHPPYTRIWFSGERRRRAQAGYFGLIEQIDTEIDSLIRQFKERSEKAGRPWVIVFTSDHGEMLFDHGYFRKCEPYQGAANIPFIIAASPEMGLEHGLRNRQPVCLEDIMPTVLALAGVRAPSCVDGTNLVPVLRGKRQNIREVLHFEHARCYSDEQEFHALTDGRYKYIWRPATGREQLFDLDHDPSEINDLSLADSFTGQLEMWRKRLRKRLEGRPEGFVQNGELVTGRPYPPLNRTAPLFENEL